MVTWARSLKIVSTLALLLVWIGASAASTDSISSLARRDLPSLQTDDGTVGLAAIDGRVVVLTSQAGWLLDRDSERWSPLRLERPITGSVFGDGLQSFVLSTNDGSARLARLTLAEDALTEQPLPSPPFELTDAIGAQRGDSIFLTGVDASGRSHLLRYSPLGGEAQWRAEANWDVTGRPISIAVQNSAVYVIVDRGAQDSDARQLSMFKWSERDGLQPRAALPAGFEVSAVRSIGQAHLLYIGAVNGQPAFMSYHAISDAWAPLPYENARPIASTPFGTGFVTASPGTGGLAFSTAELVSVKRGLSVWDWAIIIVYLGAMIGVGVYFYMRHRQGSAAEFFVGSRSIPFWAAGVSLYATNTSSISYVAIPAKAFETDWQYMMSKLVTILGLMFVAVWIVPLLRRLNLVSVFNYLEMRFHPTIRMLASALCMLMHVGGRMSVVLFLPALAIATITGFDVVWSILIMGICTIVYTAMGGMRAVVWTDFTQVIVLMGGAIFAIGFIIVSLGTETVYDTAMAFDKTKLVNLSFDLTEPTVWGFLFLILFDTVLTFPKDQVLMQRTLATDSDRNAGRSIWIFAAIMLPGGLIFYGIGTLLFVYYKQHPERLDPLLPIDATFPLFIAAELPTGLTGLIIAGIFAAAMGTLSSTINSVATLLSVDFFEKLAKNPTQERSVRFAEWMSVVIGLIAIALALLLSRLDIHSLLDLTIELAGLLGGGFAGAYTLGMFTKRANSAGVSIGVVAAIVITLVARWFELVHPYFYLGISIFVCIVVGYVASLFFPAPTRSLAGLTIFKDA